jgi:hypothetical protein
MRFYFIFGGQGGDEMLEVGGGFVFDGKIVNDEGKGDGEGGVAKEHGGGGFEIPVGVEDGDEFILAVEAGLREAGNGFGEVKKTVGSAFGVVLEEGGDSEGVKNGGGDVVKVETDGLGGRKTGPKIEVRDVYGGEEGVFGDSGMEEGVDGGESGSVGAHIKACFDAVTTRCVTDAGDLGK